MKKFRYIIPAALIAILFSAVGMFNSETWIQNPIILSALVLGTAFPIVFSVYSKIVIRALKKKHNNTKLEEIRKYHLEHREKAEETAISSGKKLRLYRVLSDLIAILVFISGVVCAFLAGVLTGYAYYILIAVSTLFICSALTCIRIHKKEIPTTPELILKQEEYPALHKLVNDVAQKTNCKYKVAITFDDGEGVGVFKTGKEVYIRLGVMALCLLTEEELYNVLFHEFYHVSEDMEKIQREDTYFHSFDAREDYFLSKLLFSPYSLLNVKYYLEYMLYKYATSIMVEQKADRSMLAAQSPEIALSALTKFRYYDFFDWEEMGTDVENIAKEEELQNEYLKKRLDRYFEKQNTRKDFWNTLLEKEIIAQNASHPTVKMRAATLGVDKIQTIPSKSSEAFVKDTQKLLAVTDNMIYESRAKEYPQEREERYLTPLNKINEWEANGSKIESHSYADIVDSYMLLGMRSKAEAFCDRVIEILPEVSTMHAKFTKGMLLLHRYDASGLELLYSAIKENHNYLEQGLENMGQFCCMMGLEDELWKYREFASEITQKHVDENSQLSSLERNDNLVSHDLPREILDDVLNYIKSIDESGILRKVYLVKKVINEQFSGTVFVLHFYGGTDRQQEDIYHEIFRYLDSYPCDINFALFDYFSCRNVDFEKIEGSLIYEKGE